MHKIIMCVVLTSAACFQGLVAAEEQDAIITNLEKAKQVHTAAIESARTLLLDAFDREVKEVAETGDLDAVKSLQAEKTAFYNDGKVPTSARMRTATGEYQGAVKEALPLLEKAYDQAIKESTKALKIDQAEAIRAEWQEVKGNQTVRKSPARSSVTPKEPQVPATKEDLKKFLSGTEWAWENETAKLKPDGYVALASWDARGLITRWESIDRRTVLFILEKGRNSDRIAILRFSEDLREYNGYDFVAKPLIAMKKKR